MKHENLPHPCSTWAFEVAVLRNCDLSTWRAGYFFSLAICGWDNTAINTKASLRATFRCYHRLMPHKISPSQFLKLHGQAQKTSSLPHCHCDGSWAEIALRENRGLFKMLQLTQHAASRYTQQNPRPKLLFDLVTWVPLCALPLATPRKQ